jgi:Flp pilus assembly protein TadD
VAVLRFENLSGDPAVEWQGRALAEAVSQALDGSPALAGINYPQLHAPEAALGVRPAAAPGISSERSLALAAGARRIAYGEYTVRASRLEARLAVEEAGSGKILRTVEASAPSGDIPGIASELARRAFDFSAPPATRSAGALRAYSESLESRDPGAIAKLLEDAITSDADYGAAYRRLAQLDAAVRNPAGAREALERAAARGAALSPLERARVEALSAELAGDPVRRGRALGTLSRLEPADPAVRRSLAESEMSGHHYTEAAAAFRAALAIEPDDPQSLNQLGYACAYSGDLAGATAALRRYQALRPAEPNPLDSLGDVNLIAGRLAEAESFYLESLRKDPGFLGGGGAYKAAVARLMTGDIAGADALAKRWLDTHAAAHDAAVPYRAAQWAWLSGRRREARGQLESFARGSEAGPLRELAALAYAELAVWDVALGHRDAAAAMARRAAPLAGPASAGMVAVAAFLAQPPTVPEEWTARAARLPEGPLRQFALACALLADGRFDAAARTLDSFVERPAPLADEGVPIMRAWALSTTGRAAEAEPLLRANPVPPAGGFGPFVAFYRPRVFWLRAQAGARQRRADQARAQAALFLKLSGPEPLAWGEEAAAGRSN